jgi:hypothetical protein
MWYTNYTSLVVQYTKPYDFGDGRADRAIFKKSCANCVFIHSTWPLDGFWVKVEMNVRDAQNLKLDLPDVWARFLPLEGLSDAGPVPMLHRLSGLEGMFDGGRNTINSRRTALNMCRLDFRMWWWKKAKCTSTTAPHNLLSYWVGGMSWRSMSYGFLTSTSGLKISVYWKCEWVDWR